jgi:hypothetical protein
MRQISAVVISQSNPSVSVTGGSSTYVTTSNGAGISVTATSGDTISVTVSGTPTLTPATAGSLGGVRIGPGISVTPEGVISASSSYTLPAATSSALGGVIIGSGLVNSSGTISATAASVGAAASSHSHAISDVTGLQTALDGKQASGTYATLVGGTVPSTQLPSYVDDVLEFAATANFPATGESGKIYVATGTGKVYRWSGSAYVEIIGSPGSTDAVPEGSVNLYYTAARAAAAAPVQSVNGLTGAVVVIASYATADLFPATGNAATLYVETDTGRVFQWTGSVYAETGIDSASGQHASQHGAAGSDPITIATSQITNFNAAAAAAVGKPIGLILALT